MAFIKNSTCLCVIGEIPISDLWYQKPIIIHTSAIETPNDTIQTDNIERYHVITNKWDHIGYVFTIEKDGTIFYSDATTRKQYHCAGGGQNRLSMGICVIGDGTQNRMTLEQKHSVSRILDTYDCPEIRLHRDFPLNGKRKECPGDALLSSIEEYYGSLIKRY